MSLFQKIISPVELAYAMLQGVKERNEKSKKLFRDGGNLEAIKEAWAKNIEDYSAMMNSLFCCQMVTRHALDYSIITKNLRSISANNEPFDVKQAVEEVKDAI